MNVWAYFGIISSHARWVRQVSKRRRMGELRKGTRKGRLNFSLSWYNWGLQKVQLFISFNFCSGFHLQETRQPSEYFLNWCPTVHTTLKMVFLSCGDP